jgi:hypothetical protein
VAGALLLRRRSRAGAHSAPRSHTGRPAPAEPPDATVGVRPGRDREAIFEQLVRLERSERADGDEYATRREALVEELIALDAASEADEPGA